MALVDATKCLSDVYFLFKCWKTSSLLEEFGWRPSRNKTVDINLPESLFAGCITCQSCQFLQVSRPGPKNCRKQGKERHLGEKNENDQCPSLGDVVGHLNQISDRFSEVEGHNRSSCPCSGDGALLNVDITNRTSQTLWYLITFSKGMSMIRHVSWEPSSWATLRSSSFPTFCRSIFDLQKTAPSGLHWT